MRVQMSLLEYLSYRCKPAILSDLHDMGELERNRLARAIGLIQAGDVPLGDWNDALLYLSNGPPQPTAEAARERLMDYLYQK